MRLVRLVLAIVVGLIVTVDCMATTNDAHEIDTSMEYAPSLRRELDERSTESEERGRRGGGRSRIKRTRTHTSIGLMYPNATPYLKEALSRFKSWLKRTFGKKE
ncbi:hypothetical protein F442_02769 [Phytophthora nicotianae P10297]|uniref:RxLR effector protein n=1 Tax=Phytophthora nicotianae P10297 TaxID=1317064 RepID=W2ZYU4_PHYNI|nr:hypothetical protein F442_02769 [Phytophthora nicotianae P10297]